MAAVVILAQTWLYLSALVSKAEVLYIYMVLLTACYKVIERAQRALQRHLANEWLDVGFTPCRPY